MKRIEKVLRFAALIVLILLACVGVGLGGPIPVQGRNKHGQLIRQVQTEQVEKPQQARQAVLPGGLRA